jgi:putative ABC transport system substrate-binding protein
MILRRSDQWRTVNLPIPRGPGVLSFEAENMGLSPGGVGVRRREFITLLGGAAAWPFAARAQQSMPVIGFLNGETPTEFEHLVVAFRGGLDATGYVEGRNVAIDFRWADGQYDRLPTFAADLVRRQVALIVAADNKSALAARKATSTIPIVFATRGGPVSLELLPSLNRPNGNVTGVAFFRGSLGAKRLGLLRDMAPKAQVIGVLLDPKALSYASERKEAQEAARPLGIKLHMLTASSEREIDAAFAALAQQQVRALLVTASPYFSWSRRNQILALAARHAIPAMYTLRDWVADGGLMSYGTILSDTYRQVGVYAGKILKGAKPGDLPIEQSSRFEFVINRKTAKSLGLDVPTRLLALADEMIE